MNYLFFVPRRNKRLENEIADLNELIRRYKIRTASLELENEVLHERVTNYIDEIESAQERIKNLRAALHDELNSDEVQ